MVWPERVDREVLFDLVAFKNCLEKEMAGVLCHSGYNELLIRTLHPIENLKDFTHSLDELYEKRSELEFSRFRYYLPVCYDESFGEDLPFVCNTLDLGKEELIQLHTQNAYTVFAIGFLPGFMYLGGLEERLFCKRKEHPRVKVPKGSVGIGGQQTGIYPQESPGGWQLIGRCPVHLFQVERQPPFFAQVGDEVKFFAIEKMEFEHIQIQVETGIYQLKRDKLV